jgi:anti-sigma B factor antagonist
MEGIEITSYHVGVNRDIALLKVRGFIDTTTSPDLQKIIAQTIEEGIFQFVIDLGMVHYVSSAGWGVFVGEIRGLREKGGDLKIVKMTPEVFEVFEMLEFNRILTSYDSPEEAIDDFDFCLGHDLGGSGHVVMEREEETISSAIVSEEKTNIEHRSTYTSRQAVTGRHSHSRIPNMNDSELPLSEKVRKMVVENPVLGPWSIKRLLYSPRFGYTKIGYFKLRGLMKRLALESKAKRIRYYRSRG